MKALVHLNALRAFEASARHRSFSAASAELHVTPAAVGQLVRTLEEWLGAPLFHRAASGQTRLVPTRAAERALPEIKAGLDKLALGLARLRDGASSDRLAVAASPAFAAKWLLPRIQRFRAAWPEMDFRLDTDLNTVDFATQRIDIGIRYGAGNWSGLIAEKLLNEEVYPVCSPEVLRRLEPLAGPADLEHEMLIHDLSMDGHTGFPTWKTWLAQAGVQGTQALSGMWVNNSAAVLQAAIEGQGVALARSVLAHDDVNARRLVRLFPEITFPSKLAFYVVYRTNALSLSWPSAFRDWLFEEAAQ